MLNKSFLVLFFFVAVVSFSCSVFEKEEDHSKYLLEHRGIFEADIDGNHWEGQKITVSFNKETNKMSIGAGQGSDTVVYVYVEDIQEKLYKRDTANPAQSAHWQMLQMEIEGLESQEGITSLNWETGYLDVLSLTADSVEAQFEFTTKFNVVKNGYAKLYIGEE